MKCAVCGAEGIGEDGVCPACLERASLAKTSTGASSPTAAQRASAGTPSLTFEPGEAFGPRYTIVEEVGSGGMGRVYKAIDRELGGTVALKLIRSDLAVRAAALDRFRREIALAQQVSHPNVCRVHDLGEVRGIHYISMEFIDGQTLEDLIRSVSVLSPRQVAALGGQICAGLKAVHDRGIVHRDLKPGNIMLDRSGRAVVMDFGLAYNPEKEPLTAERAMLGTFAYLSPEQVRGDPLDRRSDIYSVGLILFEMLAGRRPPGDMVALPLALRDSSEACPPPSRFGPDVPSALDAIVLRCLARDPSHRYPTVDELMEALGVVATGFPSGKAAVRLPPRQRFPKLRSRPAALGALAVVCVLAAFGLFRLRFSSPPRPPAQRPVVAVLPLTILDKDPADDYLGVGIADTLITRLAALSSVTVVSRAATLEYRGRTERARRIASDLGVNFVVQGGIQRAGERLHVTLNLVRLDDSVAWGKDYDGSLEDLFSLQARLAEDLGEALAVNLTRADRQQLARPPARDPGAFADYARGRALLERPDVPGSLDRAIAAFRAALGKDPKFAVAHAGLGEAYWAQYQETHEPAWTARAVDSITEALRLEPDEAATRVALALVYRGTGKDDATADELRHALQLQPANDEAHRLLGEVLAERGRTGDAIAELNEAIALRPRYWRNHASLGRVFFQKGRYAEAVATFQRVTELQPDNSRGFQMLGAAYQAQGDTKLALESYQHALERRPDARAYSNIGNIYYYEGRFDEAVRAFEEAARLEPGSPMKQGNLGDAYARLGQADRARRAYLKGVELAEAMLRVNPKDAQTLSLLGLYEAKLGRRAAALRHVAQATALAPEDGQVLYEQAATYVLLAETRLGLASLERALAHGYSPALARQDEDLAALRKTAAFKKLVDKSR